jgi:hypothetical protein
MNNRKGPSRAPIGVVSGKPISMRLLPDEREALMRLSKDENRSMASMARRAYLAGLPLVARKPARARSAQSPQTANKELV